MAQLSISRPGHLDETVLLPDGELMLGRQPGSDVVVEHPSVSRSHALIAQITGGHVIRDIGSANGTWVNGVRVGDQPVLLQPDDQIFLGEEGVVLTYLAEEAVAQAPARRLVWVRAALGIAIVGTIAVAVTRVLARIGGGDTDSTPGGPVTIPTTRAVEISIKGGATLSIPEGAFSEEVELSVLRKEKSELPDTIDTSVLVSNIYEVEQNGLADLNKLLRVSLPYQEEALPQDLLPEDLTVVRWDGERWEELPSTVDTAAKMVSAQVGHFSFVSIAASTTAYFRGLDQSYTVIDDSGSPLFIIQYASKGSHKPPNRTMSKGWAPT